MQKLYNFDVGLTGKYGITMREGPSILKKYDPDNSEFLDEVELMQRDKVTPLEQLRYKFILVRGIFLKVFLQCYWVGPAINAIL